MLPIGEARAAIPLGILVFGLSPFESFFYAVLGNLVAVFLVFFTLEPFLKLVQRQLPILHKFLEKILRVTRKKHSARFKRFEEVFLFFFVAVPWPGSGGYTGVLLAWLFAVPRWPTLVLLASGVVASGLLVLGVTIGIIELPFLRLNDL